MSNDPKLVADSRGAVGTASTKKLRRTGRVPGNIYGHHLDTLHFSVLNDDLAPIVASGHKVLDFELDGKPEKVIIKDVQWDTFSKEILHLDLLRVDENERIHTEVDLVVRGIAPGVLAGGILEQPHHKLPIDCPVIRLPDNIVVRVTALQLGESIHVGDLELPAGVTTTLPPEEVVVHVIEPRKPVETTADGGEPEVISSGAAEKE